MFDVIKRFYDKKIYSKADVKVFVQANKITAAEYQLITNEPYVAA